MQLFELLCAEVICVFSCWYIRAFVQTLTYGLNNEKKIRNRIYDRPLWDQVFMVSFPFEKKERIKEKLCYVGLYLTTWIVALAEIILYFVRQYWVISSMIVMAFPMTICLITIVSGPFLVPEEFAHKGVETEQAGGVVLLLGVIFYLLVYVF